MEFKTWDDVITSFPYTRYEDIPDDRVEDYTRACFDVMEYEGFAPHYWTPYSDQDLVRHIGERFKVVCRLWEPQYDLEVLPAWRIRFENGEEIEAYPEEIILSAMIPNGYKPMKG